MKLTDKQKEKLKEHAKHHTKKHMDEMKRMMRAGVSFAKAHTETKKKGLQPHLHNSLSELKTIISFKFFLKVCVGHLGANDTSKLPNLSFVAYS